MKATTQGSLALRSTIKLTSLPLTYFSVGFSRLTRFVRPSLLSNSARSKPTLVLSVSISKVRGAGGLGGFGRGGDRRGRGFRFGRRALGFLVASDARNQRRAAQQRAQRIPPGRVIHCESVQTLVLPERMIVDTQRPSVALYGMSQTLVVQSESWVQLSGLTFSVHLLVVESQTKPVSHSKSAAQVLPMALLFTQASSMPQ